MIEKNVTEAEVVGTFAEYLANLAKTTPETEANERFCAALDADEMVRVALRRLNTFLTASGEDADPLVAEGGIGVPGVEGSSTGLWLDDLKVVAEALGRRGYR